MYGKYEIYSTECTGCKKTPWPYFVSWWEGPKQRFTVKQLYVGPAYLRCRVPSKWVWLSLEMKQNYWSILKKSCNLLPVDTSCSNVQEPTSIHIRRRRSRDWCVCSKMRGCCCLNDMDNKILCRINWRCINQGFKMDPQEESIGGKSGDVGGQAAGPRSPI